MWKLVITVVEFSPIVFENEIVNGDSNSTSDTFVTSFLNLSLRLFRKISKDRTSEVHWRYLSTFHESIQKSDGLEVDGIVHLSLTSFFHSVFTHLPPPRPLSFTTE